MVTIEAEELLAFMVDLFAGSNVDEKSCCDCHPVSISTTTRPVGISLDVPYGTIESSNSDHIEILRDPTPDCSIAIDMIAVRAYNKEVGKRRDERYTIAGQEVPFLHDPDLLCVVFMEECQVDIASHRKRPICISAHEPISHVRGVKTAAKDVFYIWMRKPWTWHKDPVGFPMADRPIRVAILVMIFPTDAKKTSLLIGLWKDLEERKVTTITAHPNNERLEHTLSMVTIAANWSSVSPTVAILIVVPSRDNVREYCTSV
jgi:hypothetical protein